MTIFPGLSVTMMNGTQAEIYGRIQEHPKQTTGTCFIPFLVYPFLHFAAWNTDVKLKL